MSWGGRNPLQGAGHGLKHAAGFPGAVGDRLYFSLQVRCRECKLEIEMDPLAGGDRK